MRSRVQLILVSFGLVGCLSPVPEAQCVRDADCNEGVCVDSRCTGGTNSMGTGGGGGSQDAGPLDSGPDDAGGLDAGTPDASAGDAGAPDAGGADAGGEADAGLPDAGLPDAGLPDAGAPRCSATNACAAIGYKFEQSPDCGTFCYYDEPHNIAVNGAGQGQNPANFNQYALGQLVDGVRGNPDWTVNSGNGPGYAWVGWLYRDANVVFQFAETREFSAVTVGLNNHGTGAVYAPSELRIQLGDDGVTFGAPWTFRRADSTLPAVAIGTRGDVRLPVPGATGKFVRVTVVYSAAWSMVDEFAFE